jgi:hypothetical protein
LVNYTSILIAISSILSNSFGTNTCLLGKYVSSDSKVDVQSQMLNEIYEYLLRLTNPSNIIPKFQSIKLRYASFLVDLGFMEEASKYCDSIASSIKAYGKSSTFMTSKLLRDLRHLGDRLSGAGVNSGYVSMN